MNLFNQPCLAQLSLLIASNCNYYSMYDLIVDHDGEIFISPSCKNTSATLKGFRLYLTGLNGKEHIGLVASRNLKYLNALYRDLFYCWDNNLKGCIHYDALPSIKTLNQWLKINDITSSSDLYTLPTTFITGRRSGAGTHN